MPSERTKELVARFEGAAANEAIATHVDEPSPETVRSLDAARAALLSHYAEIEAVADEYHQELSLALRQLSTAFERIAKMQAVLDTAHITLTSIRDSVRLHPFDEYAGALLETIEGDCDEAITAIQHAALDALPSSTEDDTERVAAIARSEINRGERASHD